MIETISDPQIKYSLITLVSLLIARTIIAFIVLKIGKRNGIIKARVKLINRYITSSLLIIALLIEAYIFGAEFQNLVVVFSSVFAVLGIALFAVWSILSNVTAGIIMFFSFPFKVGDKVEIHDKEIPLPAVIEDIRAFHLHLRLENGDLVTYPNNMILQKAVTLVEKI